MPRTLATGFVVFLLLAVACSNDTEAEDYAQDCVVDADCVTVLVGDPCDCDCEAGAISRREEPRFREDRGTCNSGCANQCGACFAPDAVCQGGRCVVGTGRTIDVPPDAGDGG